MSLEDPHGVRIEGKMYRRDGGWRIVLYGPSWATSDFAMEAREELVVLGWGGSSQSEQGNVMLGTKQARAADA